jgi:hypothetical protein
MHMKAKRPVLVPHEFVAELDRLSKATLMDLAYDLAATQSENADEPEAVMTALRERLATVQIHREGAQSYYAIIKANEQRDIENTKLLEQEHERIKARESSANGDLK